MAHPIARTLITALSLLLIAQSVAHSQTSQKSVWPPTDPHSNTWRGARAIGPTTGKLFVVAVARPTRRQTCRIQSFDEDQLVCAPRHGNTPVIYRASEVAALISPGIDTPVLAYLLTFVGAGAGVITGAVFLASVSSAGAAALGIVGVLMLLGSPVIAMAADGNSPDSVLYLAPGQTLQVKLRANS